MAEHGVNGLMAETAEKSVLWSMSTQLSVIPSLRMMEPH